MVFLLSSLTVGVKTQVQACVLFCHQGEEQSVVTVLMPALVLFIKGGQFSRVKTTVQKKDEPSCEFCCLFVLSTFGVLPRNVAGQHAQTAVFVAKRLLSNDAGIAPLLA